MHATASCQREALQLQTNGTQRTSRIRKLIESWDYREYRPCCGRMFAHIRCVERVNNGKSNSMRHLKSNRNEWFARLAANNHVNRIHAITVSGNERRSQRFVSMRLSPSGCHRFVWDACVPINHTQLNVTRRQAYSHKWEFRAQSAIDLDNVYVGDCRVAWRLHVFWIVSHPRETIKVWMVLFCRSQPVAGITLA